MLFQEKIIEKVKNKSKKDTNIASAMTYGSFTNGEGDRYSDVEFYIFLEDDVTETFSKKRWVSEIYPVEMIFKNEYGTEVVIFENLIRAEFHFLPVSKIEIIKEFKYVGYFPNTAAMYLYDSTGKLKSLLDFIGGPSQVRDTEENVNFLCNNFLNVWLLGVNVMKRGELARCLEQLSHIQKYTAQLIRIEEEKTEHWLNQTKQLEKEISTQSYDVYHSITSKIDKTELEKAYRNALNYLENFYLDYKNHYSFEIDEVIIKKMRLYL